MAFWVGNPLRIMTVCQTRLQSTTLSNSPDLCKLVTQRAITRLRNISTEQSFDTKCTITHSHQNFHNRNWLRARTLGLLSVCFFRSRGNGCKSNDAIDSEGPNSGQKKMYFGKSSCQSGISKSRSYVWDILCILKYPSCDLYCINYSNPGTLQPFHQNTRQLWQLTLITSSSPNNTSATSASSSSCRLS